MKLIYLMLFILMTSCSELLILSSGAGVVASQNVYAKAYNGVDMITVISTKKDIKKHIYEKIQNDPKK
tara:strand:+ start:168 stop:371 length:204 start_codon:yes stop_codon:yes gene_type:complete